ncbi:flagellar biosynthesis protein FlhF [Cognatilysobacter bugurensis]|uniref:Flagellar biosynthesis protein FlhF n=1 Tax=Cognatilysobacter bugurensis TaxID=543356 RepID=A0A918W9H3_9GAMM|nr:flagellar biosynthesis protein FlhF [Lysobacter bugurensis]GHA90277.1 hypothetical protein GCM10007067_30070 [Lysobacter bugurensis]
MRIKRFVAPDMRTALRMVRDEQGADAVILSNRSIPEGIEVVAATDYDEALVQQALRTAAPGTFGAAPPPHAAPNAVQMPAPTAYARQETAARAAAGEPQGAPAARSLGTRAEAMIAAMSGTTPRDSLAARARAVFRVDAAAAEADAASARRAASQAASRSHPPALASLLTAGVEEESVFNPNDFAAASYPPAAPAAPAAAPATLAPGDDFRELLARLSAAEHANEMPAPVAASPSPAAQAAEAMAAPAPVLEVAPIAPVVKIEAAPPVAAAPVVEAAPAPIAAIDPVAEVTPAAAPAVIAVPAEPVLQVVATPVEDPTLAAMRNELASMRELIERQMDHYAIERLRGSAGRAHVFDTLLAWGCDESVAQNVAGRIDAQLSPEETREPMLAELARMIMTHKAEPIDDGGVIALVGPTGAGKTTTIAKLAARFAARHRARDVALVTTDVSRAGAREQLHAHGRRLGITVCEAEGPEALNATLDQLADYPLVLVDTAGYAARDRALLSQILWLRTARRVRSLLVLPANAHPHDLSEVIRRYRPASPEGVVLTKTDETGRLGAALSVLVKQDMHLAYTTSGQQVPHDIEAADPVRLVASIEKLRRAADNPLMTEDRHAVA